MPPLVNLGCCRSSCWHLNIQTNFRLFHLFKMLAPITKNASNAHHYNLHSATTSPLTAFFHLPASAREHVLPFISFIVTSYRRPNADISMYARCTQHIISALKKTPIALTDNSFVLFCFSNRQPRSPEKALQVSALRCKFTPLYLETSPLPLAQWRSRSNRCNSTSFPTSVHIVRSWGAPRLSACK